jgi:triosephosphate isomerase
MTLWVGTSWKMTKGLAEAREYAAELATAVGSRAAGGEHPWPGVQPFVLPPLTAFTAVRDALAGAVADDDVLLGVQNAHWDDAGAWTGEVSVPQVAELGARLVEIGHSERRAHFGETDETVRAKTAAVVRHGLVPLVCVGETQAERAAGRAVEVTTRQLDAALAGYGDGARDSGRTGAPILVAYEPVWAIGESGREPLPDELAEVVTGLHERGAGVVTALLYGGSVNTGIASQLLDLPGVQGLFVGRGAWSVDGLVAILDAAVRAAATAAATETTQQRPPVTAGEHPAYTPTSH